jgi:hydroxymethylpyrimidine pyrophosphatase-like HAD family hydrolase
MKNIESITHAECARIRGILFDIDDTFTHEGKMLPSAFQALWDLHDAGLITVPLTGRPAGWCDHFARMWPVDGVVGENGAFYGADRPPARRTGGY